MTLCFIDILKIEGDIVSAKRAKKYYKGLFHCHGDNGQADETKTNHLQRLGNARSRLAGMLRINFKRPYSDTGYPQSPLSETAETLAEKDELCESSDSDDSQLEDASP